MPIRVKCEQCKKTLSVKDHLAGKKIKCPICQTPVLVGPAAPAGGPADSSDTKPAVPNPAAPTATKKTAVLGKPVSVTKPTADRSKANGTSDAKKNGTPHDPAKNGTPAPPAPPEMIDRPPESAEAEALALFAEELKPKEDEGPPKTIDFTCEHCDQELHLPLSEGGKRMQCPNPECRQLIKVPLPKIEAKKDWRKMDRVGPAAALVNQPEQLEDAWSSQNATKARQASLAQAGALKAPPKPRRDATAWLFLGVKSVLIVGLVGAVVVFASGRWTSARQHKDIDELKHLADHNDPKRIVNELLRAEAKRVLALHYLNEPKGAYKSKESIDGAGFAIDEKAPASNVNEQLFLVSKAIALIEQGGDGDDVVMFKARRDWGTVGQDLGVTLGKISDGQLKATALREIVNRLIQKKKDAVATLLAGQLGGDAADAAPALSQRIALRVQSNEQEAIEEFAEANPPLQLQRIDDAPLRSGFAEGYARLGDFDKAAKVALTDGPAKDRVEACLGVAAIALAAKKSDEASKCVKEALKIAEGADDLTDWNLLELIQLSARTEDFETAKKIGEKLKGPDFKTRALLEIFLAKCDKATGKIDAAELLDLEAATTKDDYVPLALAWEALARHNTQFRASRGDNRKTFDDRMKVATVPEEIREALRQMVDVGTYLGSVKSP